MNQVPAITDQAKEPRYRTVDRFQADECIRRRQIVEQLNPKEIWHVVCRTPVQGLWEDGTVVKYRVRVTEDAVEPHAELKAMYEQQVKNGTLDDFVWEVSAQKATSWLEMVLEPKFEANLLFKCTPKPTCQVRNLDTGELKTMTREAAKKLYKELGDTVYWAVHDTPDCYCECISVFDSEYLYTYKLRGTVKLTIDDEPAKISAYTIKGCYLCKDNTETSNCPKTSRDPGNIIARHQFLIANNVKVEKFSCPIWHIKPLTLRKQPKLIPLDWKDVPVGVMTNKGEYRGCYLALDGTSRLCLEHSIEPNGDVNLSRFVASFVELAPASEQPWIAVQDGEDVCELVTALRQKGFIVETYIHGAKYRITGLAEGYGYSEQKGGC